MLCLRASRLAACRAVISLVAVSLGKCLSFNQPRSNMTSRCSLESCSTSKLLAILFSRSDPTLDNVASKICALEGGTAAMLTSSGQAASFFAVFNIAEAGDHFIALPPFYGGTFKPVCYYP